MVLAIMPSAKPGAWAPLRQPLSGAAAQRSGTVPPPNPVDGMLKGCGAAGKRGSGEVSRRKGSLWGVQWLPRCLAVHLPRP